MKIEKTIPSDLDEIVRIEKENFPQPWPMSSFLYDMNNEVAQMYTLKDGEVVVGYYVLYLMFENADIGTIAIDLKYQGRGLGEKLLKHLISKCIENEVEFLHLEVRVSNFKAINLYKKFGFEQMRIRKGYYDGEDGIDMVKGILGLSEESISY